MTDDTPLVGARQVEGNYSIMFSKGYRPKSSEHHVAVVSFAETVYSAKFSSEVLQAFGKARLRRSESMYDRAGSISETQGRNLVEKADIFINKAKELLKL